MTQLTRRSMLRGMAGAALAPALVLPSAPVVAAAPAVRLPRRWNVPIRPHEHSDTPAGRWMAEAEHFASRWVADAILSSCDEMVFENSWETGAEFEDDGQTWRSVTDADVIRALSTPVPMGLVFRELCASCMLDVPPIVATAFEQLRPVYFGERG